MPAHSGSVPWGYLLGAIALETTLLFIVAIAIQRFLRGAAWRRTLWQATLLGLGIIVAAEVSGVRRFVTFPESGEPGIATLPDPVFLVSTAAGSDLHEVAARLKDQSLIRRASLLIPAARGETVTANVPVWWPGWFGLTGFCAVAIWVAMARLGFVLFVQRHVLCDEATLARVNALARRMGMRRRIMVSETPGLAGPIAFGILRPGISLPQEFVRRFTATQQEAMLAHELAHLAARDPFWHALADVLAALLWWHPLVWLARRQLRAASEAAADEASLLVENGPTALAECLVELGGRLTRSRSLAWLGMEGGEFRSGLGRRVKRLVTLPNQPWKPVRKTGDWLVKTLGVSSVVIIALAATAWLQPREARSDSISKAFKESVIGLALIAAFPDPQVEGLPTEAVAELTPIDWKLWSRAAVAAARAEGNPVLVNFTADWAVTAQVNEKTGLDVPVVRAKLREIGAVALRGDYTTVSEDIAEELRSFGRDGVPLVLVYAADSKTPPKVLPAVLTSEIVLDALEQVALAAPVDVTDARDADAVREKNRVTGLLFEGKLLYESGRLTEAEAKWREAFRLDPQNPAAKHYLALLDKVRPVTTTNYITNTGSVPTDRGLVLNTSFPQVTLDVKICELPEGATRALGFDWFLGNTSLNAIRRTDASAGILTDPQYRVVLKALAHRNDVKITHLPKVTTLSGRQAQIKAVTEATNRTRLEAVQGVTVEGDAASGLVTVQPIAESSELGPLIDIVPYVESDGMTISMTVITGIKEFLGHENMEGQLTAVKVGDLIPAMQTVPLPNFRLRSLITSAKVFDGQTLVLSDGSNRAAGNTKTNLPLLGDLPFMGRLFRNESGRSGKTKLIIFVTPTLIDPAGNKISPE